MEQSEFKSQQRLFCLSFGTWWPIRIVTHLHLISSIFCPDPDGPPCTMDVESLFSHILHISAYTILYGILSFDQANHYYYHLPSSSKVSPPPPRSSMITCRGMSVSDIFNRSAVLYFSLNPMDRPPFPFLIHREWEKVEKRTNSI